MDRWINGSMPTAKFRSACSTLGSQIVFFLEVRWRKIFKCRGVGPAVVVFMKGTRLEIGRHAKTPRLPPVPRVHAAFKHDFSPPLALLMASASKQVPECEGLAC